MSTRLPRWLRVAIPRSSKIKRVRRLLSDLRLVTVCDEARCPNRAECYGCGTATFMILGDVCTRDCRFCAVKHGRPAPPDPEEPERVAEAVRRLNLKHAVITSVTRDDLNDGGAAHFAATIRAIRQKNPNTTVEVLVPDFRGDTDAINTVLNENPTVFNHNVETVPRLYPIVRPQADFERSIRVLSAAKRSGGSVITKSGFMVGLGESWAEVAELLVRLKDAGVDIVTVGQYLKAAPDRLDVVRYWHPEEFERLREFCEWLGFKAALCAPLVRSSHNAAAVLEQVRSKTT